MIKRIDFPNDFKFGVSDADLQVISEELTLKNENSLPTMWTDFATKSNKVYQNQSPLNSIDRYSNWKKDADLIINLGVSNYRVSISMSRILTEDGGVNLKAIDWYKNYLEYLKKNNISISATLYHWELPLFLHQKGGWLNKETIFFLEKHTEYVYKYLNDYIDDYIVFNEPWCASMKSYWLGGHAPGDVNLSNALKASHNQLLSCAKMTNILKSLNSKNIVSIAFNNEPTYAYSSKKEDIEASNRYDGFFNSWFKDPIYIGKYPSDMVKIYEKYINFEILESDLQEMKIGEKLDFMAFNYYCGQVVKFDKDANLPLQCECVQLENGQKNDLGWPVTLPPVYENGLYDILIETYNKYKNFGLSEIRITENGLAKKSQINDGKIEDIERISYYKQHLSQVAKAIKKGVPVTHFYAWTLMDNYEWEEGYKLESSFGLIYVDRKTLERKPKNSYFWYKDLIS